ncbi:MAG: DNA-directed RNA polymerase subunit alpha [Candidatus Colwellbacteria bacterium RIFCSPHIGHO2_12_FULL_44_17]|uniref:DNA-directed RNA polymerase subunit alpha n=2 Tax=Candidatus Colwelliibacteriota TaxID=1817904 RepID=A0A1G1Z642_9BACT|nr:MAG: DNA-directed RNA polymerase subunit alpha [Candidatus Colwellbacteria bacterium RIFCSPHIGHO2_12_FULL_44_17]OGY60111.1 MAG: DNA-directed RNA polymerase subunit alpha [Candidatus Colwellbacteria bacterium RIFCSPLOWO2_02_FULL_44_20b]
MEIIYLSESIKIKRVSEDEKVGVFDVEGLYPGYGLTVGSALRRVLFSSLPGAAITHFKIRGVSHEFSTLPGVLEDIVDIALNLKSVRFKFFAKEPQVLTLSVKGERAVTAADIKGNADVQVENPDVHIATLTSKNAVLDMEITVERGLGYVPVEARKSEKLPIGVVAVDAIFSPVLKVNYELENMRVGDRTDYNRLHLHIETDGTVSPSEALHKAANVLLDHFKKVSDIDVIRNTTQSEEKENTEESISEEKAKKKTASKKAKK